MASGFAFYSFLLYALILLQCEYGVSARMTTNEQKLNVEKEVDDSQKFTDIKPQYNIWFTPKDLYKGFTKPFYFAKRDPTNSPQLLSREKADKIPFAISQYDYLLSIFSIEKDTEQAKAIRYTLVNCDLKPTGHEIMACVSSLESMLDFVQKSYGPNTKFDLYTSAMHSSETSSLLQNYTILEAPQQISKQKMIACHPMPYPYAIFYCHGHLNGSTKVYKIPFRGENGDKVEAIVVCHSKTTGWDEDHISFKMLHMKLRSGSACHLIPHNNFLWLPSN